MGIPGSRWIPAAGCCCADRGVAVAPPRRRQRRRLAILGPMDCLPRPSPILAWVAAAGYRGPPVCGQKGRCPMMVRTRTWDRSPGDCPRPGGLWRRRRRRRPGRHPSNHYHGRGPRHDHQPTRRGRTHSGHLRQWGHDRSPGGLDQLRSGVLGEPGVGHPADGQRVAARRRCVGLPHSVRCSPRPTPCRSPGTSWLPRWA